MNDKALANFFYEQCAGTHSGHMAHVANNPVLFGLVSAATGTTADDHAASKEKFAKMLREIADKLDEDGFESDDE